MPAGPVKPARTHSAHLDLGQRGEDAAAELLSRKGYTVVERNVRLGRLELDLVCQAPAQAGGELVFVEVKTRGGGSLGSPADGLTPQKCERLLRAARQYLSERDLWSSPCRFDLIAVTEHEGEIVAEHVENALSAEDILAASGGTGKRGSGGSSGSWQPW